MSKQGTAAAAGVSMGSALAMILSFQLNHSILWGNRTRNLFVVLRDLPRLSGELLIGARHVATCALVGLIVETVRRQLNHAQ